MAKWSIKLSNTCSLNFFEALLRHVIVKETRTKIEHRHTIGSKPTFVKSSKGSMSRVYQESRSRTQLEARWPCGCQREKKRERKTDRETFCNTKIVQNRLFLRAEGRMIVDGQATRTW